MNTRNLLTVGGVAALSLALIALPAPSANSQSCNESAITRLEQKLERLQARLEGRQDSFAKLAETRAMLASDMALAQQAQAMQKVETWPELADVEDDVNVLIEGEGSSWLGVELHEVTGEKAKEFKLPAERGVVLGKIVDDSPAAKAGLKENDVVTEINGQRVEGAAQFRRMIHEIPAGRQVQLTVWRDGKAQSMSVTLGKSEERRNSFKMVAPKAGTPGLFTFHMPEIPEIPPMEWNGTVLMNGQPRLGIDAEELNGQLGNFFGAPEGEGILVREVNPDSPAEKAGVKAGDVITTIDGERIRTLGELREKLAAKREAKDKDRTIKLGVLRNRGQVSLNVELPAPAPRAKRTISHRTSI
ncbi:MAG TPA: PDZ domain-containing protein [Candidatus Angelobacter sp.]|nr:PDZ domain-containing protein [Candidatus Angelobacter sp.]